VSSNIWNVVFLLVLSTPNLIALWFDSTSTKFAAVVVPLIFFFGLRRVFNTSNFVITLLFLPLFFFSYVDLVYLMQFNVQTTAGLISAVLESDTREGFEFVREAPVSVIYASLAYLAAYIMLLFWSKFLSKPNKSRFIITLLLIILPLFDMVGKGASARSFPLGSLRAAYIYTRDTIVTNKLLQQREGFTFNAKLFNNDKKTSSLNIIFILGETSRRDYYSLYGFSRKTNPNLENITPLAVFKDAISPSNATIPSLMSMLYMATVKDSTLFYTSNSIVSLAKEASYRTFWLSSQARFGEFDATSGSTGIEAHKKVFINQDRAVALIFDEELLPYLDDALIDNATRKFIVMHLYGSHLAYDRRYPKSFDKFKGIPPNYANHSEEIQSKVNAYTNSILYSDYIINETIKRLSSQNTPSCMIYTSDHGEYLADSPNEEFTGHGYPIPHKVEVEVPLVVWCSKEYREQNPEKWSTILANQQLKISNEDMFYSLADLLEIDFHLMKQERSFLGKSYEPLKFRHVRSASDKRLFKYRELDK